MTTNSDESDKESGKFTLPPLPPISEVLSTMKPEKIEEVQARLKTVSLKNLRRALDKALSKDQRASAWLVNCELTNRGIPPAFRGLRVAKRS